MSKFFLVNPNQNGSSKEDIDTIEKSKQSIRKSSYDINRDKAKEILHEYDELKCVSGRVVVKSDLQSKNEHSFNDGNTIRLERQFNNFNRRHTEPVNCIVISSEKIPQGTEIIVDHNSIHEAYQINSYKNKNADVKYYSVPEDQCYLYRDGETWKAIEPYETALQVFRPYGGHLIGTPPIPLENTLWVTSGEYKNQVVKTLIGCNYCVIFQDINGREKNIIRFLPNGYPKYNKECEAIAVMNTMTDMVNDGKLLIGITPKDAKKLNEYGKDN